MACEIASTSTVRVLVEKASLTIEMLMSLIYSPLMVSSCADTTTSHGLCDLSTHVAIALNYY